MRIIFLSCFLLLPSQAFKSSLPRIIISSKCNGKFDHDNKDSNRETTIKLYSKKIPTECFSVKGSQLKALTIFIIAATYCCVLVFFPLPGSFAAATTASEEESLPCPQSFSSQALGIQSVRPSYSKTPIKEAVVKKNGLVSLCPTDEVEVSSSQKSSATVAESSSTIIQGLIYLPSDPKQETETLHLSRNDQYLIIQVAPVHRPDKVLAGAKIPMIQISSFPINFRLVLANKEVSDFDVNDLYVTSKITGTSFQDRGLSKMLLLPDTNGDLISQRVAASIRLTQSDTPDRLFTW